MHILILRPGAIGDWLLTFPILRALREQYPDVHLTLVGNPAIFPLAKEWGLAEDLYDQRQIEWDELYSPTVIHNSYFRDLLQQADLTICWMWIPQIGKRDINDQVKQNLLAAGAKEVIVAHGFSHLIPSKHLVDYLAESIGLHNVGAGNILPITTRDNEFCLYYPPIAIHPGSSGDDRRWPAASFAAVINHLLGQGYPVLLLAGPSEVEVLKEVRQHLSPPPEAGLLTVLQNASLLELALRIKQCRCYLGNNTGITHLAALLGIPTLALFGRADLAIWDPVGPSVEVIHEEHLERLTVDKVLKSVLRHV